MSALEEKSARLARDVMPENFPNETALVKNVGEHSNRLSHRRKSPIRLKYSESGRLTAIIVSSSKHDRKSGQPSSRLPIPITHRSKKDKLVQDGSTASRQNDENRKSFEQGKAEELKQSDYEGDKELLHRSTYHATPRNDNRSGGQKALPQWEAFRADAYWEHGPGSAGPTEDLIAAIDYIEDQCMKHDIPLKNLKHMRERAKNLFTFLCNIRPGTQGRKGNFIQHQQMTAKYGSGSTLSTQADDEALTVADDDASTMLADQEVAEDETSRLTQNKASPATDTSKAHGRFNDDERHRQENSSSSSVRPTSSRRSRKKIVCFVLLAIMVAIILGMILLCFLAPWFPTSETHHFNPYPCASKHIGRNLHFSRNLNVLANLQSFVKGISSLWRCTQRKFGIKPL